MAVLVKIRRCRPPRDRAAWRIAGAGGPMADCQGPLTRKNPIPWRATRQPENILGRPGGGAMLRLTAAVGENTN